MQGERRAPSGELQLVAETANQDSIWTPFSSSIRRQLEIILTQQ